MTVYSLDEVKERGLFPGFVGKFIHSENMTFVYWDVAEGSPLPAHSHPHEQVINMFAGAVRDPDHGRGDAGAGAGGCVCDSGRG